jgi:hypothetical protein
MSRGYFRGSHSDFPKEFRGKSGMSRSRVPTFERARLAAFRVIQRDLVYVIGIPVDIANEDILAHYEYFGQYGSIKKIVVNNQTAYTTSYRPTVSAYVTFHNVADAWECIYALENFSLNNIAIKASFGTSKYCSSFLNGQKCSNPDCMYLHYNGNPEDSFAREEIEQNSPRFVSLTRPTRPADYFDYPFQNDKSTKFPCRRLVSEKVAIPQSPPERAAPPPKEDPNVPEEEFTEKKRARNEFLASLWSSGPTFAEPLKVDYIVGRSLLEQFDLGTPTIRAIYIKNATS